MSNNKGRHKPTKPPAPSNSPSNRDSAVSSGPKSEKRFWRGWEPMEKFTFVIAVFTVIYSIVTVGMYKTAKDTLTVSQRAFVYAETAEIVNSSHTRVDGLQPSQNSKTSVYVTFKNSGQTPAISTSATISVLFEPGIPKDFGFPEPQGTQSTLVAPQSETHDLEVIPDDKLADVESGKTNMFVYGTFCIKMSLETVTRPNIVSN
jgi:hypothetical protein